MESRKQMQRKWKKDKEKGRWIKKVESGKETQRETQEKKIRMGRHKQKR
jgi:hypothetical protein